MRALLRRLRARIKYRHFERDLAQELEQHRSLAEAELTASGGTAREARWQAARQLGNTTLAREESRAAWVPRLLEQIAQDVRYALRGLRNAPGFAVAAVLLLIIGFGPLSGVFALFNGLFLRGWDVADSGAVFIAGAQRTERPEGNVTRDGFTLGAYRQIRNAALTADYAASLQGSLRVSPDGPQRGRYRAGLHVDADFIHTLRLPLQLGNGWITSDAGSHHGVLIADSVWRTDFDADPNVIGRPVWVNDTPAVVSGVLARGFDNLGLMPVAIIAGFDVPPAETLQADTVNDETRCCISLAGRLRGNWSRAQAQEELAVLTSQQRKAAQQPALDVLVRPTQSISAVGLLRADPQMRTIVSVVSLAIAALMLVLVLIWANVGSLFLARSLRREREIAVRLSIGASRARVVRQLLTEGLVLAALAGVGATLIARMIPALVGRLPISFPPAAFSTDWRVTMFVLVMIVATCLVVSLAPALQLTRMSWRGAVMMLTARTGRTRGLLLATQIAVALTLVLSAMLLTRSVTRITTAPTDFALHTTLLATVQLPADAGANLRRLVRRGLEDAGARSTERIGLAIARRDIGQLTQYMKGARRAGSTTLFMAHVVPLSTGAVDVLALELARGRWYADNATSDEAVINETLARRLWGDGDAVGQALEIDNGRQPPSVYRIVGISRDAHLTRFGDVDPTLHVSPLAANLMPALLIRNTPGAADRLNAVAHAIDPSVRLTTTPLVDLLTPTLAPAKVAAAVAGSLGAMALTLAVIGVFGVFSYLVEERRREIGIRLALGASRAQTRRALFAAIRWSLIGGTATGVALSLLVGAALRSYLYGMSPADPWSFGLVAIVLTIAALGATAIPLRRAMRVDPAITLRAE